MRLAGKGSTRKITLEGSALVGELLRRAIVALAVPASVRVALWCESRTLLAEETLAEAGVGAGGVVFLHAGEGGGTLGCFGFGTSTGEPPAGSAAQPDMKARLEAEARRHAEVEARLQAEVEQLRREAAAAAAAMVPVPQAGAAVGPVAALRDGAGGPGSPGAQPARFTEADEDRELLAVLFADINADQSGTISNAELTAALCRPEINAGLKGFLESLLPAVGDASAGQGGVTREAFAAAFEKLPRVRGERVKWARDLGLEGAVAQLLPPGDAFDGLKGLRALSDADLTALAQRVAAGLASALPGLLIQRVRELRASGVGAGGALEHVNTKFSLDGAFVGRFATLRDFHSGPEGLIGTPNPRIEEGICTEHCRRANREVLFITSNYNVETWPSLEYEFVLAPRQGFAYPHTPSDKSQWGSNPKGWKGEHGRDAMSVEVYFPDHSDAASLLQSLPQATQELVVRAREKIEEAGLLRAEVIGLRLYTGPMFVLYNAVLRGFPEGDVAKLLGNRYETTIFTITSGIAKLAKVSDLPKDRLLFRGLGGMILPRQFWDTYDECIVTVLIVALEGEAAPSALAAMNLLVTKSSPQQGARAAYDIGAQYLQLPLPPDAQEPLREAVAGRGIRIASQPREATRPLGVSLELAVPAAKLDFERRLSKPLVEGLRAALGGRPVTIVAVAAKPRGFRGGGTPTPILPRPPPLVFRSRSSTSVCTPAPATHARRVQWTPSPPLSPPTPHRRMLRVGSSGRAMTASPRGSRVRSHVDDDRQEDSLGVQRRGPEPRNAPRDHRGPDRQRRLHQLPLPVPRRGRVPHAAPHLP